MNQECAPLLTVNVSVDYWNRRDVLQDVRFELKRGEILGLVGQSGSGKSTIALAILRLLGLKGGRVRGSVLFEGQDLLSLPEREMRKLRGRHMGLVLQSPLSSLNPVLSIGTQLREAWRIHAAEQSDCRAVISDALSSVSLPANDEFLRRRVSEISVGQAQRVLIAMAVLHHPSLLIADEPTSALDVATQAEILALFRTMNQELGISILFISHDLLSVGALCDRVAVLRGGKIAREQEVGRDFRDRSLAYSKQLASSII